jgi:hypothetical protein
MLFKWENEKLFLTLAPQMLCLTPTCSCYHSLADVMIHAFAPLYVCRHAIDDYRLYRAVDVAGLEGWLVVVDTVNEADVVLATKTKRTGKVVDLGPVQRAAERGGVPFLNLATVSAERLLEGLGPILGLQLDGLPLLQKASQGKQEARLLPSEETDRDGGDVLLALLWGLDGGGGTEGHNRFWEQRVSFMQEPGIWLAADLWDDDVRDDLLPLNPNQRAGEKVKLVRPLRHGSRIKRRRLQKFLDEQSAPW